MIICVLCPAGMNVGVLVNLFLLSLVSRIFSFIKPMGPSMASFFFWGASSFSPSLVGSSILTLILST
jgi:type IV secretory pathway VirB3-like protein